MTRLSIERPLTILMGILTLVLLGAVSYTYLRVDRLPPLSLPVVNVVTNYPQATAGDVEELVTKPIEDALAGVAGAETIESTSSEGRSLVRVRLYAGADPNLAALDVERRIARIRNRLPIDAEEPGVFKADPNEQPILNVALTGAPLDQLFDLADAQFQPQLQSVLGVSTVNIQGGLQREVQVQIQYSKLASYNVSVQQVSDALRLGNVASTVGSTEQGRQQLNIRAMAPYQSTTDLGTIVVAQTPTGTALLLRDVAVVKEAYKQQRQLLRFNGQPAVGLSVVKNSEANALQVADDVKTKLKDLQALMPAGSDVYYTNDSSIYTRRALDSVQSDLILAVLLVGLVTLLFLHEWKNVVIILLSIPTSMVSTFLLMFIFGFTLNLMTLMALALSVGILVDASIVVIENIHRHLQMGTEPKRAALLGRNEIGMATIAIALADIVVYVPIAFMSGFEGQLFRQYGLTVVIATVFSLLISFTLTPMLASRWLTHEEQHGVMARFGAWWDHWFDRMAALVQRTVPRAVQFRWVVLAASIALVVASSALIQTRVVGTEYIPQEDNSNFRVNIKVPPGSSLQAIQDYTTQVEAALQAMPEVKNIFSSMTVAGLTGSGAGANIDVELYPKHDRTRGIDEILGDVRRMGRQIAGARITPSVNSPIPGGGGSGRLDVRVIGPDLEVLNGLVAKVTEAAQTVPGLVDVQDDASQASTELRVIFEPTRMAQLNVTSQQAMDALRTTLGGRVASVMRVAGKEQQDITVIATDVDRNDLARLREIPVRGNATLAGAANPNPVVTLGQIATLSYADGPVEINRVDRNRTITVFGTAVGRPLGDVARDLQDSVLGLEKPGGYAIKPGIQVNRFNTAMAAFGTALLLAIILEYMLLVALYESWVYPMVLMLSVPLGLVGSIAALAVSGNTINIFSVIGLVMAFGLVAKNGILLIDFANSLRKQGMERTQALAEATRARLRPILMTSATMVFGMFPLALKFEEGAESRAPMAVVVIGAILTSTVLAVVVIPAVYVLLDDLQLLVSRRRHVTQPAIGGIQTAPAPAFDGLVTPHANGNGAMTARPGWLVRTLRMAGLGARITLD